jgi:hypothetical protein
VALQKIMTLENNFGEQSTFDCYIKISEMICTKQNAIIKLEISKKDRTKVLAEKDFSFVLRLEESAKNPWSQGYAFLKTLDEFSGSLDC